MQKVVRKIKEEPLIPLGIYTPNFLAHEKASNRHLPTIGMGLTTLAFINAYRALRRGDSKQANRMFRARVAAQGFTVFAMLAGSMYYQKDREKSKELRQLQEQKDAEEKRQKWIRELEARDEEEKAMRARLEKRRQQVQAQRAEEAKATAAPTELKPEGTEASSNGGILSRIGLWPQGGKEEKKEDETAVAEVVEEDASAKKKNPKSSLGDLGEIISKRKD
ncbi:Respiratory supercomplex factor 1, mitochondrial, partial [Fusarium sp. DS 682]